MVKIFGPGNFFLTLVMKSDGLLDSIKEYQTQALPGLRVSAVAKPKSQLWQITRREKEKGGIKIAEFAEFLLCYQFK